MGDRRHYEWAYPTREYRLEEDDQGHYFMSAVDPRDGQGVTVRVVDNELADRVLILAAELADAERCEMEARGRAASINLRAAVDVVRARAEGRLEGMRGDLAAVKEIDADELRDDHFPARMGLSDKPLIFAKGANEGLMSAERVIELRIAATERELAGGERPDSRKDAGDVEVDDLIARRKPKP